MLHANWVLLEGTSQKQTQDKQTNHYSPMSLSCFYNNSPSASTSFIISWSSASVGFCPRDRITVPNSFVVMVPSPSLSKRENASLNSVGENNCNLMQRNNFAPFFFSTGVHNTLMISRNQTNPQEPSLEFLMEAISFLDTTFNPLNK